MKINRILFALGILLLVLIAGACNLSQPEVVETDDQAINITSETATPALIAPTEEIQPTASQVSSGPSTKRYTFDQLGISLEVPAELYVSKNPGVNYDDPSRLDGYAFYIQNYGHPGGSNSGDFQMYGSLQYDLSSVSWEQFAYDTINSPMNAYANEIEINGLRGFDTQLSGVRNRFVYHFYLNGHILSIAVSAPTEENKALSDQIISTIIVNPDQFTNASQVQLISEPDGLYQMYIPDDWTFQFNQTSGIRLSDLEASSPDAEVVVEDVEGPHSNIYYKNGVFMNIVVLEDDSAKSEPNMASIQSSYPFMFYGIEGMDYLFTEPSTAEGVLREIRYFYDGNSFILRFGYTMDVDQELLDWLILNFIITQQEDS